MGDEKHGHRFSDRIANLFAEMITDIRRRVVEEPWWGKPLDGPIGESGKTAPATSSMHAPAHGSAWDWQPDPRASAALQHPAPGAEGTEHDHGSPGEKGRGIDL